MKAQTFLSIALMLLLAATLSLAQVPKTISYQGVLTDTSGTVVPDGNYNLTFKLYDVATGGTALWAEGQLVAVSKGIFNVVLGSVAPLNLPFDKPYWLGVTVGAGAELTPRIALTSSAYSLNSRSVEDGAITTSKIADGAVTSAKLASGISLPPGGAAGGDLTGTYPNPSIASGAVNTAKLADNAVTSAKIAVPLSLSGSSADPIISGSNSGSGYGVYGSSSSSYGVRGNSSSGYGVLGTSSGGPGVYGYNSSSGNYGYLGNGSDGVLGYSATSNGNGVVGIANNGSGAYGVYGSSSSGYGVYGSSSSGTAVYGYRSGAGNYAGFFYGNVTVTGTLSKGGGTFKIDHPLDPANKYLYHSFVESPDMMNIYNGNVVLDANGEAWVELPAYFEALNKDFRYQLTPIGAPAPNLYIAQKISGNRFKIAGGAPRMTVSWQVTGIRHDPFAEAHRIQVEVEKTGKERGKYIHPKEYGVPESLGIDYEEHQKMEQEQARMKAEQEKIKAEPLNMQKEMEK